jgi:hypothetical protein
MGVIGGLSTPSGGIAIPWTSRLTIAAANTEEEFIFPSNTKQYKIINDGNAVLKLSYQETESGTEYIPIYPGDSHEVWGITAPSVTIYLQSPKLIDISLEYWQ